MDVSGHAAVAVLTNRTLWELITDCMTEYPYKVHQFYQRKGDLFLGRYGDRRVGDLHRNGVLFHLAIAADNPEMIKLLFTLATKA